MNPAALAGRFRIALAAAAIVVAGTAAAQPYGLASRANVGPYFNGTFPLSQPGPGMPATLSATGLFTNLTTLAPSPALVPYTLVTPLWSDAAVKSRWVAVPYDSAAPANPTVTFSATGDWTFPAGTVFVKHFELVVNEQTGARRRLETRVLVRDEEGYIWGRTYKWRLDGTDADLIGPTENEVITVTGPDGIATRNQTWTYPSPMQCRECHTLVTGGPLGPKTGQLNGDFAYTASVAAGGTGITDNQLRTWNHLGLFDTPLVEPAIATYERFAALDDASATLERRARSYLDANCAYCHRAGGPNTSWIGTYDTPILQQNIAGSATTNPGAKLWRHDLTSNSRILYRDERTSTNGGMPPVAKNVVDANWIVLLMDWITHAFDVVAAGVPGGANDVVRAVFNAGLDSASATDVANYALDNGAAVTGAVLEADGKTVTLATTSLTPGQSYTLTVNRVREAAAPGNPGWPNSNQAFVNVAPGVTLQLESASYAAGEGAGTVTIGVSRIGGAGAVSVGYGTTDGTAIAGPDFTSAAGTLDWADGDTATKYFAVAIVDDAIRETEESFRVFLASPTGGAAIGDRLSATVTITDNDAGARPDFDANGKSDLLWANADGRVAVWLMNGLAPSSTAEILPAGTGFAVAHMADFDGDGTADLLWQHADGRAAVWLMNGTLPSATQQILNAGSGWTAVATPDLDGDGKADIIWQHTDGTIAAWLMNGTAMSSGSSIIGAGTGWSVTKTGDFDGDGKGDLVWTHSDGRVAIWLMDGLAPSATNQILNAASGWSVAHAADLDGDGKVDLVWQHTDGSVAVWLMNGAVMSSGSGILGAGSGWFVAKTADFDGDGKMDLLWQHPDGRAAIWLMNGLTPSATTQILNAGGGWTAKRTGDLDGDGKADIVWENVDGSVAVWLMNGAAMSSGSGILGPASGWSVSGVSP